MKRLALLLMPIAVLAGLLAWLLRPSPQAPLAPGEAPAPAAPEPEPEAAEATDVAAPAEPPDEPLPDEPAVVQKLAASPAEPLLWYRGLAADGSGAVLWSHPKQRKKLIAVRDGQVGLRGADKPDAAQRGALAVAGGPADGPMLISVGAKWCKPCMAEMGDLIELAESLTTATSGDVRAARPRLTLILQDEASEWTMAEVRDRFFAEFNSKYRKGKSPLKPPLWFEVRADLESQWGRALEVGKVLGSGPVTLPVNLLVDRCGHVQAIASGSLDAAKKQLFADAAARLKTASCSAMPVAVAPGRPRPVALPRAADPAAGKAPGAAGPAAPVDAAPKAVGTPPTDASPAGAPASAGSASPTAPDAPAVPAAPEAPEAGSADADAKPTAPAPLPMAVSPTTGKPTKRPPPSAKKP